VIETPLKAAILTRNRASTKEEFEMSESLRVALERIWGTEAGEHGFLDYSQHPLGNMMQMHNDMMMLGRPKDHSNDRFSLKLKGMAALSLEDVFQAVCSQYKELGCETVARRSPSSEGRGWVFAFGPEFHARVEIILENGSFRWSLLDLVESRQDSVPGLVEAG
jgi:hypothetical protein